MHKYITLFFSVTFFLCACNQSKAPEGIIKHDEMIRLLTDVHIIDGRMFSVRQDPDSLYKYGTGQYLALFKKYHTDTAQFRKSFRYYTTQPAELNAIYMQIAQNLKDKTDSLDKIQQHNAIK